MFSLGLINIPGQEVACSGEFIRPMTLQTCGLIARLSSFRTIFRMIDQFAINALSLLGSPSVNLIIDGLMADANFGSNSRLEVPVA